MRLLYAYVIIAYHICKLAMKLPVYAGYNLLFQKIAKNKERLPLGSAARFY